MPPLQEHMQGDTVRAMTDVPSPLGRPPMKSSSPSGLCQDQSWVFQATDNLPALRKPEELCEYLCE